MKKEHRAKTTKRRLKEKSGKKGKTGYLRMYNRKTEEKIPKNKGKMEQNRGSLGVKNLIFKDKIQNTRKKKTRG